MIKFRFLFLLLLTPCLGLAQVTFCVDQLPQYYTPLLDDLYVAGNFNNWDPGDPAFKLQKNGSCWEITVPGNQGDTLSFKFTRGDWPSVETNSNGGFLPNRSLIVGGSNPGPFVVEGWDDLPISGTATGNTHILDMDFAIPQLGRQRRIWIRLPDSYYTSTDSFPVLYMHDGQNLFDQATSFAGEWGIDESMTLLEDSGYTKAIVVGIDNGGGNRISEYSHWVNPTYGGGEGDDYMQFLIQILKPFIDSNFRAYAGRESTALMGSSLGGLITFYGGLKYQETFSRLGLFSPSYWFAGQVWNFSRQESRREAMRIYQLAGALEGQSMVPDMWAMHDSLMAAGFSASEVRSVAKSDGEHKEWFWRREFPAAFKWLFEDLTTTRSDAKKTDQIKVWPNPAWDSVHLELPASIREGASLKIFNIKGEVLIETDQLVNPNLSLGAFAPGYYYLWLQKGNEKWYGRFFKTQ